MLVLRGEAGVGKTALLDYLVERAAGCRVVRAAGVESEMELAFAGLHQLCAPLLDRLGPAARRRSATRSRTAFGLERGRPAGPVPRRPRRAEPARRGRRGASRSSASSTTRSGSTGSRRRRSPSSRGACWPSASRSSSRSREPERRPSSAGCRSCASHGLRRRRRPGAAGLGDRPGRSTSRCATGSSPRRRGNPLALLELPRGLTPARARGRLRRCSSATPLAEPDRGGLPAHGCSRSPPNPAAAAGRGGRAGRRRRRCCGARPSGSGIARRTRPHAAEAAGLLELGARVRFRHPLVRSAVYRSARARPSARAVHRALAEATDAGRRPRPPRLAPRAAPRRARTRTVAAELERSAGRAQARGGLAAAAAFLQRAAELTPDPARRAERALAAAQAKLHAGAFDAALGCSPRPRPGRSTSSQRRAARPAARPDRVRLERADATRRRCCSRPRGASSRSTPGWRARPTSTRSARRCSPAGWRAAEACARSPRPRERAPAGRPTRARRPAAGRPGRAVTDGLAAAAPPLQRALRAPSPATTAQPRRASGGWLAGARVPSDAALGRRDVARAQRPPASSSPARRGALARLPIALTALRRSRRVAAASFARRAAADRARPRRSTRRDRHPDRALRRVVLAAWRGTRGRGRCR